MAFPVLPLPSIWSVPVAVGVPALSGQNMSTVVPAAASTALGQIISDAENAFAAQNWGIFDAQGASVLTAARVWQLDFRKQNALTSAPIEDGQFAAYDKVSQPWVCVISFLCDGSESGGLADIDFEDPLTTLWDGVTGRGSLRVRQSFFARLDAIVGDTQLYDIRMPERRYRNGNVTGYRFTRRAQSGVTMPVADVTIQEVLSSRIAQQRVPRHAASVPPLAVGSVQTYALADSADSLPRLSGEFL